MSVFLAVAGLLAAMTFSDSHAVERQLSVERIEEEVRGELARLQQAVNAYRRDHGRWPGTDPYQRESGDEAPRATSAWLLRQLLLSSDEGGRCAYAESPEHPFGPYLWAGMPSNPVNGLSSVRVVGLEEEPPADPDGTTGWVYDPKSGRVRINSDGTFQREGTRFYDL